MNNYIETVYNRVLTMNPIHGKKLKRNLAQYDATYFERANAFMDKYERFLKSLGKDIDYGVDCYLTMLQDMVGETVDFMQTGKYASTTFDEVNSRVYSNPAAMEYYMHGLLLSQFLWKHHYLIFEYFVDNLPKYSPNRKSYLEIGAGHGLYLSKALDIFDKDVHFSVVDISETSIQVARNLVNDSRVEFKHMDIFDYNRDRRFDFITMGEVIEHVEDPLKLLARVKDMLADDGVLFITTPTNAPTIDHIYLFRNIKEIQDLLRLAGFEVLSEKWFPAEDVSPEKIEIFKVTLMYGAFLKKA